MTPSYMIQPGEGLDERARKRKLAEVLMMQGMDASPVQSWTQGADRLAKALLGGYQVGALGRQDASDKADARNEMVRMLGGGQPTPSVTPAASADAATPTDTRVPAAIRNNNPGAMWPGPSSQKFGATGVQDVAGGNKIASFPDPEAGAAAQFDLLNRRYTNMKLADALAKWSGGNNASAYTAFAAQRAGVTPDTVITPEFLASPQGVKLAQAMSRWESGRDFPLMPEQWVSAQSRALGQRVAALPSTTMTDAGSGPVPVAGPPSRSAPPAPAPVQTAQAGQMTPEYRADLVRRLQSSNPYIVQQATQEAQAIRQKQVEQLVRDPVAVQKQQLEVEKLKADIEDKKKPEAALAIAQEMRKNPQAYGFKGPDDPELIAAVKQRLGGSSVNIDQRQEGAFKNTAATGQAKRFLEISDSALAAKQNISDLDTLQSLGAAIETGKLAEWKVAAGPYLKTIGIDVAKLGEGEAYDAIVQRLAPGLRTPGSGTTSDRDVIGYLKSLPSLGKTPEGNAIISATNRAIYESRLKAAEIADAALSGEITPTEANKRLLALPDPMAQFREHMKKSNPAGAKSADELRKKYGLE